MRFFAPFSLVSTFAAALALWGGVTAGVAAEAPVQFNQDIRPILADNCYTCHGPDSGKRKANLRLDTRQGLFSAIETNYPVVPGKPEESEIYRRITTDDPDDLMPKSHDGQRLPDKQIALIKRWIEQGAKWEGHWAYTAPVRPREVKVRDAAWVLNPIDDFVLARIEKAKLEPSSDADKRTLLRRLSFDLTGLPPTPEEVLAFEKDNSAKAYERAVDRLLASPHYGERMAEMWLDEVRYADTDGFHADNYRSVYPYRDYVIDAFNADMPFDRFTREQIAGDLLPNATTAQKIASTYNRLSRSTEEGGAQPKEYLAKYAADRVRTTSEVWLGSTMGCCECHDHKFDPFTTKDFYSFEAFFADIKEQGVGVRDSSLVPDDAQAAELKNFDARIEAIQKTLETPTLELDLAERAWEDGLKSDPLKMEEWHSVGPFKADSFDAAFDTVYGPETEMGKGVDLAATYESNALKWVARPEFADGEVHNGLQGDNASTYLYRVAHAKTARMARLYLGSDDAIKVWVNGAVVLSNKVSRGAAADQDMVEAPLKAGDNTLLLKIVNGGGDSGFYFKADIPNGMLAALKVPREKRTAEQEEDVSTNYRAFAPLLANTRAELAIATQEKADYVKTVPTSLVTVAEKPRVTRVLPRGNWMNDSGEIVMPAEPAFLVKDATKRAAGTNESRLTRLDLANWIVSRQNPLTARVFVNRLWKMYFGIGISKTLDDFGTRGEWPANPELLDWLATEFMDHGWDVKHMVKLMVMSHAYRQTAVASDELRERDPENRLVARQSAFRLNAEMVHDNALAVSGLLVEKIGGPSVKPYQPEGYWDQLNFPKRKYVADHGDALYRRGLYTFWCRTFLQPSLEAFDAPSREECTINRPRSNTPLQALALLNDPTYVEAARALAEGIVRRGGAAVDDRIDWMFMQTLDREPTPAETSLVAKLYREEFERYEEDAADAKELISVGERPVAKDLDAGELAAWTEVARAALNLHETITRY